MTGEAIERGEEYSPSFEAAISIEGDGSRLWCPITGALISVFPNPIESHARAIAL